MDALITSLVEVGFPPERILPRAPMAQYTTFRVGGEADVLVRAASAGDIETALRAARECAAPVTIIGNGSNLLVRDGGIRGLVVRVAGDMARLGRDGDTVFAQAGVSLSALALFAQREGLSGLAEISGIPGTVGGGVVMNAGAYGGELSQVVSRVDALALSDLKPISFEGDALGFSYRHSAMMDADVVVTSVTLRLSPGDPEALRRRMDELAAARREKQPLEWPSAGSAFKRPPGRFAAKLIDECGLRGLRIGGAQVSEKHAGFIVNRGGATASDILQLMDEVKRRVLEETGVLLEPEVRVLGEDAQRGQG